MKERSEIAKAAQENMEEHTQSISEPSASNTTNAMIQAHNLASDGRMEYCIERDQVILKDMQNIKEAARLQEFTDGANSIDLSSISDLEVLQKIATNMEVFQLQCIGDKLVSVEDGSVVSQLIFDPQDATDETENISESFMVENPNRKVKAAKSRTKKRNKDKLFDCGICGKGFTDEGHLRRHLASHTKEKPHECRICRKKFSQKGHLNVHMNGHSGKKKFVCDICDKAFLVLSNYKSHLRVHSGEKPFKCDVCDKSFTQRGSLIIHKRIHTGEKPYPCKKCDKKFSRLALLKDHMKLHSGKKEYFCDKCDHSFLQRASLTKHARCHDEIKHHSCKECGKSFTFKQNLEVHLIKHSKSTPYKCKICEKEFKYARSLICHMRLHEKDSKYTCRKCGKHFSQICNMKNHRCWAKSPNTCAVCKKDFKLEICFKKHLVRKHIKLISSCVGCEALFVADSPDKHVCKFLEMPSSPQELNDVEEGVSAKGIVDLSSNRAMSDDDDDDNDNDTALSDGSCDWEGEMTVRSTKGIDQLEKQTDFDLAKSANFNEETIEAAARIATDINTRRRQVFHGGIIDDDHNYQNFTREQGMPAREVGGRFIEDNELDSLLTGNDNILVVAMKNTLSMTEGRNLPIEEGRDSRGLEDAGLIDVVEDYVAEEVTVLENSADSRGKPKKRKAIKKGIKTFPCTICHKSFSKNDRFQRHLTVHTKEKPHHCDICSKDFSQKSHLRVHIQMHNGVKKFSCEFCGKSFGVKSNLKSHIRVHTGEKPFECDICKKSFNQRQSLTAHKRMHTGEKPYICDICKVGYSRLESLKDHLHTHTGLKDFSCDVCEKAFRSKSLLRDHKLKAHEGQKYHCDVCEKDFASRSSLSCHKRQHTGDKPYKCKLCNMAFTNSNGLKFHSKQKHKKN